ncbi:hypothetical protein B0T16DRAFT_453400 [Cercophora newfieldiana]|uniref:DUF7779 domain-containing protein n=1 Tax=Cercophora newfieldiana TaxID=92897 RepID=A0AA39YSV8_9PEZI|nr:hypothetical protein B0T16DRAFT_453400 [Cercophora newfieldiana]
MPPLFLEPDGLFPLLDDKLLPLTESDGTSGLRTFALCGARGTGKSIIASHYLLSRRNWFDAAFFVSADSGFRIAEAFSDIAVQLKLCTPSQAKDRIATKIAVLGWLSQPKAPPASHAPVGGGQVIRWLLVFDGVESEELLKDCIPSEGTGSILFTSRDPSAKHFLSSNSGIDLSPPPAEESAAMLHSLSHPTLFSQSFQDSLLLVRRLDCLPIAVRHMAGVIQTHNLTSEEALSKFERAVTRYKTTLSHLGGVEEGELDSPLLPTVWALHALPPAGVALLQVISLFDHCPIPQSLLERDESRHFVHAYPPAIYFPNIRTMLNKALLLSRDKVTKAITVHRVVQDTARQIMSEDEFVAAFQGAVVLLSVYWKQDRYASFGHRDGLADWQIADIAVPHVSKLAAHFETYKPELTHGSLQRFINLIIRASLYLKDRSNWAQSLRISHIALTLLESHEFELPELYADILMTLSNTYHSLSLPHLARPYAKRHFHQRILVEDGKAPTERDDAFRAMAYTELALARLMHGEYEEAITLALQGRCLCEETKDFVEGVYWPHWADYYHAWSLIGLNRCEEARVVVEEMLQWRKGMGKGRAVEGMKEAYAIQILGTINEKTGRIQEAILNWELALFLYTKTDCTSSFRANQVRVKLAEYYGNQGRTDAAREMFTSALQYLPRTKYFKAERARTLFKQAGFLSSLATTSEKGEETAKTNKTVEDSRNEAKRLFFEIQRELESGDDDDDEEEEEEEEEEETEQDHKEGRSERGKAENRVLRSEDFDAIVTIMSR